MKAMEKALTYFNIANIYGDPLDILRSYRNAPTAVSRNSSRTKGRKFASQKERANRRKAARR